MPASSSLKQTTLWGHKPPEPSMNRPKQTVKPLLRQKSLGAPFGKPTKKTKQWDRTAFAKSGWRKPANAQGKEKVGEQVGGEQDEEEEIEFEQFPAPFVSSKPSHPLL